MCIHTCAMYRGICVQVFICLYEDTLNAGGEEILNEKCLQLRIPKGESTLYMHK